MNGNRLRLVTEQDEQQHVSGLVLAPDEIIEAVRWEISLHEAGGWNTERFGDMIRFTKDEHVRWLWVRSRPPEKDTVS